MGAVAAKPLSGIDYRLLSDDFQSPKILGPIIGYAQEPLVGLVEACAPLKDVVHDLFKYVSLALEHTPDCPSDGLTRDESASIRLYTMEWTGEHKSFCSILNHALKTTDRKGLRPWFKYLKLFLTGLVKIPSVPPQTVWRGIRKKVSNEFLPGANVTWWTFSSCTTEITALENGLGNEGERTIFSIELYNGRNIRAHSNFETGDEILMLPGTYMQVQSKINPASNLCIVHLGQKIPKEMLLEPPFEDAPLCPKIS